MLGCHFARSGEDVKKMKRFRPGDLVMLQGDWDIQYLPSDNEISMRYSATTCSNKRFIVIDHNDAAIKLLGSDGVVCMRTLLPDDKFIKHLKIVSHT